jgi:hypothetical protein
MSNNGKDGPNRSLEGLLGRACVRALRRFRTEQAYNMAVISIGWWETEMLKNLDTIDELELEKLMGLESSDHDERYDEAESKIIYLFGKKDFEFQLMDRIEKDAQKYL